MFKNKIITAAVLLGLSSGLVAPALAHNDDGGDNRIKIEANAGLGVDLKDLNELRREENKILREINEAKNKEEKQKNKLSRTWKKVEKRIGNIIKGQENLSVKLDDRLDLMASNSINVTDLRTKLSTAVSLINTSKTALVDASVKASASIQTQSHDDAVVILRSLINGLKDKIKASHQALVDVMVGIKLKLAIPAPTPTPTPIP